IANRVVGTVGLHADQPRGTADVGTGAVEIVVAGAAIYAQVAVDEAAEFGIVVVTGAEIHGQVSIERVAGVVDRIVARACVDRYMAAERRGSDGQLVGTRAEQDPRRAVDADPIDRNAVISRRGTN